MGVPRRFHSLLKTFKSVRALRHSCSLRFAMLMLPGRCGWQSGALSFTITADRTTDGLGSFMKSISFSTQLGSGGSWSSIAQYENSPTSWITTLGGRQAVAWVLRPLAAIRLLSHGFSIPGLGLDSVFDGSCSIAVLAFLCRNPQIHLFLILIVAVLSAAYK